MAYVPASGFVGPVSALIQQSPPVFHTQAFDYPIGISNQIQQGCGNQPMMVVQSNLYLFHLF
jgi:hypothetical protein